MENNELYNATCFILNTCCVCSPLIVISSECTVKTRPLIEPEWGRWMEERNAQRRLEDEGETKQHTKFIHSDRGNIQPSICRLTVSQCIFTFWHSLEFLFMLWLLFWVAEVDQRCWTLAGNPLLFGFFFCFCLNVCKWCRCDGSWWIWIILTGNQSDGTSARIPGIITVTDTKVWNKWCWTVTETKSNTEYKSRSFTSRHRRRGK